MSTTSPDAFLFGYMLGVFLVVVAIVVIPTIFYLLTLSRTFKLCSPQTRLMSPGEVWLVLIPLFGFVWQFFVVSRLADTLSAEFRQRGIPENEPRPGYQLGLWVCILSLGSFVPLIGSLASLAYLILWIIYWVKIAGYKRKLEEHPLQFGMANPYPYPNYAGGYYQQPPNYPPQGHYPPQ